MKILVISGFLGAGKTTFIKELIRRTGREIAIFENEYASIGVDGGLLKDSLPSAASDNIWEMTEGCICCSTKADFASSVLMLAGAVAPDYLIVEPSGVGKLSNVIGNLQQIEYERISLLAPLTIIDGQSCFRCAAEYADIFRDQVSSAHTLVVSKMEHADISQCEAVRTFLHGINPDADILLSHYSAQGADWWDGLLETGYDGTLFPVHNDEPEKLPDSFSMSGISMKSPAELILFLENLIRGKYGNLLRAKGCLSAGSQALRFDMTDGRYAVTGMEGEPDGKAVFIGENIARRQLSRAFRQKPAIKPRSFSRS
ncbi:MAG: GTP-binding protein [Clostridiales bacterium]|nr:GTP-binding protein [Clostridiales bacterium]